MPRTTVSIDAPILKQVQALSRSSGTSLGKTISRLLTQALRTAPTKIRIELTSYDMGLPRVDLRDKDAVQRVLDSE
jgi:hypothetical protein